MEISGIPSERLAAVIARNRAVLSTVPQWISDETYRQSLRRYGLPEHLKSSIDSDVGPDPTYSDIIILLASRLTKQVTYLEMGVSVGKNFLQMARVFTGSVLVGFDIECINPVLRGYLGEETAREQWRTEPKSLKKSASTLTEYSDGANRILYLCGDLSDADSWKRLIRFRFNLVFSDAVHTPEAIISEYSMLRKLGLLDPDEFVLVWDDCAGPMVEAFERIARDLEGEGVTHQLLSLNGWLGSREPAHSVGIITRFKT